MPTMKYLAAEKKKKRGPPLVNFTQLQTRIHLSRSWYGLMYISVSVHKSRCQSQLLLSVSFLWKYNSYLSRSHRLSRSSTLFFPFFFFFKRSCVSIYLLYRRAYFLNTLTVMEGNLFGAGAANIFSLFTKATRWLDMVAFTCHKTHGCAWHWLIASFLCVFLTAVTAVIGILFFYKSKQNRQIAESQIY